MTKRARVTTIVLALAGASALLVAGQSATWWSRPELSLGPTSSWRCFGGDCQPAPLDWVPDGASWARYGAAVWAAALVGAVCLIALAGALAARRAGRLPAKMVIAAAVAAIAAGALFVGSFPGVPGVSLSFDRGLYLYVGGVIAGVAAAVVTLRARGGAA